MTKLRGKIKHASRKSELVRFFENNRAWFAKEIAEAGVPNWDAITKMICDDGILDAKGNPPNKESVRKAWARIAPAPSVAAPVALAPAPQLINPAPLAEPVANPVPDYLAISKLIKEKRSLK